MTYRSLVERYQYRSPTITSSIQLFPADQIPPKNGMTVSAVWDTGATKTFISQQVGAKLGIVPIEYQPVIGMGGQQRAGLALLAMMLPNTLFIPDKRIIIADLPEAIDMLIGMDIIQLGDLHISNANGQTLFSFVIPSLPTPYNLADEADRLN